MSDTFLCSDSAIYSDAYLIMTKTENLACEAYCSIIEKSVGMKCLTRVHQHVWTVVYKCTGPIYVVNSHPDIHLNE